MAKTLDLITMGRASVDVYGDQIGGRLQDMRSFSKYVGGCPANIAIGTSRLGLKTAFLSRVGDEQFGEYIIEHMIKNGVDVSHLNKDAERLTALAILGIKDDETFPLLFYRDNCADMAIDESDIDADFIASAKALMVSGTHFSKPNTDAAQRLALKYAKKHDTKVVFDIDYRPVLWGVAALGDGETRFLADPKITAHLQSILPYCDLIIGTDEEFAIAAGTDSPDDELASLREVRKHTDAALVLKRGALGCTVYEGAIPDNLDDGHMGKPLKIKVFNVLGAGDAFMSGFLRGWLKGEDYETCCTWANASGAIVVTRHGCSPAIPCFEELMAAIDGKIGGEAIGLTPDDNVIFKRLHYKTSRFHNWDNVEVLAFDHRSQMADLCKEANVSEDKIPALKQLILEAVLEGHDDPKSTGVLIDGRPNMGEHALWNATGRGIWVGRPVELPGARPLEFEAGDDIALDLHNWPEDQCIKVLVPWSPNDDAAIKQANGKKLKHLYNAAKANNLDILIEVIPPNCEWKEDESTVWRAIEEIQALDIFGDWWKLPPLLKSESWVECRKAIQSRDPVSQGMMVLGFGVDKQTLFQSFNAASGEPFVKGFAVGRTIWSAPSLAWLKGEISDVQFKQEINQNYQEFCQAWRNRK
ncbi:MAG: 5-dehydro-2-deoxygluconokinase [Alphaproteobacteria bacterium]